MRRVILESPYAGSSSWRVVAFFERWAHRRYACQCMRDSLLRDEAPFASHLLYTRRGILCDQVAEERQHGIDAGLAWQGAADAIVVYTDRGVSSGMTYGINAALKRGMRIEYRRLNDIFGPCRL